MVVDLLIDNQDGVVKWFLGCLFFACMWSATFEKWRNKSKWKINNKSLLVRCKLLQLSVSRFPREIEISHLNWDFQRFPWYFSIGLICTNKVELPIVKHTLMIKYLCVSCSFLGFFKGIFKVMGVCQILGYNTSESSRDKGEQRKAWRGWFVQITKCLQKKALDLLL
jgi:hypothetical protein